MVDAMPYPDGIPKVNCFSLTDFHDFEECIFRFLVRHHLDRKYEIEDEKNERAAFGNLLDQAIKKIHKYKLYNLNLNNEDVYWIMRESAEDMKVAVARAKELGKYHFYQSSVPCFEDSIQLVDQATDCLVNYIWLLRQDGRDLKRGLTDSKGETVEVGFCKWLLDFEGSPYQLWGGPDTLEVGDDGTVEVVDYKSRRDVERGKASMDMDLMPKIYVMLASDKLKTLGHKKVRFVVRFWQDPLDETMMEEFDLDEISQYEKIFLEKIIEIEKNKQVSFCGKGFCPACKNERKEDFIRELLDMEYLFDDLQSKV
jgi:hypothetical protein